MSLFIYKAQRLEDLLDRFIQNYETRGTNLFQKDVIVSHTQGIDEWLIQEGTKRCGLMANHKFLAPAAFIREMANVFHIRISSAFNKKQMSWSLYNLLNEDQFCSQFPDTARYYKNDNVKRVQLAQKLATLFLDYDYYRRNLLASWEGNGVATVTEESTEFRRHEAWQKYLWLALLDGVDGKDDLAPVAYKNSLFERLNSSCSLPYNSISIFGISIVTRDNMEMIKRLSYWVDIQVYQQVPSCEHGWLEGQSAHSFLECSKKIGSDLLMEWGMVEHKKCSIESIQSNNQQPDSLLQQLQYDIEHDSEASAFTISDNDSSILFSSSYTEVRELEALYNYLLNQFEKDPNLKPHEVLIQFPNLERYESYIPAVFDNGPKRIPYQICSPEARYQNTLLPAIRTLFMIPNHDYQVDYMVQLLEFSTVRNKFGIDDVEKVRTLLNEAMVRFGVAGDKESETHLVSWQHGLLRLVLGTAIKGGGFYEFEEEDYLLCDHEADEADLIYRVKAFADAVIELTNTSKEAKSIAEWCRFVREDLFEKLFFISSLEEEEVSYIQSQIDGALMVLPDNDVVEFDVFESLVLNSLQGVVDHPKIHSGRVAFTSILDSRTVPYKVIALLGMNSSDYPRVENRVGFDLKRMSPKPGDDSVREHDQFRFLEIVLAARDNLYLSFLGKSVKDNSEKPPSLLVEELQFTIAKMVGNEGVKQVTVQHPLHSFSSLYHKGIPHLYTFLTENEEEQILPEFKERDEQQITEVRLDDLIRFYKDPIKFYFNRVLSIYYSEDTESLEHYECLELDHLGNWSLKSELLFVEPDNLEEFIVLKKAEGALPLANVGALNVDAELNTVSELREAVEKVTLNHSSESVPVQVKLNQLTLVGEVNQIFDTTVLACNVSGEKSQNKYLAEAWIRHLALVVNDTPMQTTFVSGNLKGSIPSNAIAKEQAKEMLEQLVGYYELGHKICLPFVVGVDWLQKRKEVEWSVVKADIERESCTGYNKDYFNEYFASALHSRVLDLDNEQEWESVKHMGELIFSWYKQHNFGS